MQCLALKFLKKNAAIHEYVQRGITRSNSTKETPEHRGNLFRVGYKDTRTTPVIWTWWFRKIVLKLKLEKYIYSKRVCAPKHAPNNFSEWSGREILSNSFFHIVNRWQRVKHVLSSKRYQFIWKFFLYW